jgi:serine/threonine protein kinase
MTVTAPGSKPQTFGSYEVLEKIAQGGISVVYKARHRDTGETVALKVLAPEAADDRVLRERLQQEFRAASTLRHPNLVRALDGGEDGGTVYLVMEYVDGEDLWQCIERDGPLPEAEAVRIVIQVAQALHTAHTHGIIHRDVKPDNVLLTTDGHAKLSDLGLAKDLEASADLTRPAMGLGTPNYIAPEQFCDAKNAGVRCDVYSAAATLYTAVTGKVPFEARGISAVLKKKVNNELILPRQLVPGLSERVDWAIRRAMRANPAERHASCLDFANALTGATEGQGPSSAGGSPSGPPAEERRVAVRYPCSLGAHCNRNNSIHPAEAGELDCWEATVHDLSVRGIGILVNRRFEQGTILTVDLNSPEHGFARSLEMRVTRVRRASQGWWFHGCVFAEKLSKEELRRLL